MTAFAEYHQDIQGFKTIDAATARKFVEGSKEVAIYIGKAECPYCRRFVPKLKKVAEQTGMTVYHVNSVEESDLDNIQAFRQDYNIPTVPGFIYRNGETLRVKCDSSMPEEEIKAFINR